MSNTRDLEKLTVEEVILLLENGTSTQGLLSTVVRADTSKYNPETQKSESSQELIAKQSELVQFCLTKGANLNKVFEESHYIPASFIENNLPLIIKSQCDSTGVLKHVLTNPYGLNNALNLITKLIADHKAEAHKVSYVSSDLETNSIEFLLSKGMKGDALLQVAFGNNDKEKQKELFEFAFKHGASGSSFKNLYILIENCHEDIFEILIKDHKVPAQDLLDFVVRAGISHQYNPDTQKSEPSQELIGKQNALTHFLIGNGAKLKCVTEFSSDFVKNNLQLIIDNKVKVKALDLSKLTIEEVKTLLTHDAAAQELLIPVIRMSTTDYSSDTGRHEPNPELISKQSELVQFCLTKGAKLKDAFKNAYEIPVNFIENNLPLIIASQYEPTEVLSHISANTYGLNNPSSLITKLIDDHKADTYKILYISSALDSSSIEFLLNKGMKGNTLLMPAFQNNNQEKQKELFELAFKHGANTNFFKNLHASVEYCNEDTLKLLMNDYKVPAQDLLSTVVRVSTSQHNPETQKSEPNKELIAKQTALTNFLIGNGAELKDVTEFSSDFVKNNLQLIIESKAKLKAESLDLDSLTIEALKTLLKHNISPQELFKKVVKDAEEYDGPLSEESISKLKNLIELARPNNVDTNKIFSQYSQVIVRHSSDNDAQIFVLNSDMFKYLLENKWVDATLALEYAIGHGSVNLANLAFNYQPNINAKASGSSDLTLLNTALYTGNLDIINWLLDKEVKHDVNYEGYLQAINNTSFASACTIIERLPEIYNQDKTYEFLRANGTSISNIKLLTDYYNLIVDYLAATHGKTTSLSELEQRILKPDTTIEVGNISTSITNIYGYTPLHLAIIADKYDLAKKMIEAGSDIYATNKNGTSPLQLISLTNDCSKSRDSKNNALKQLKKLIAAKIDNVDILFDNGESLVDNFIQDSELSSTVLSKTQDPLFCFYKPGSTLSDLSKDPEKVHIAISNGEGFWSTGVWAAARLLMQEHKDVEFHLVSYKMLKEGGDKFIEQFDAFINPGAGDSYPSNLPEFTKKDCQFSMEIEQLYQLVLQKTDELKIPYLGMCAGAQHLALYHQGTLVPLEGYNMGKHEIEFVKGTTPYFLSLTPAQQWQALKAGIFPQVKFKGDTAHHFAALNGKVGQDMTLGAVSEDQVPMAYAHKNGIRYATQYHPEHHYTDAPHAQHEKAWLDNFVVLARLHHNHKVHGTVSPSECLQFVEQQLAQFISDEEINPVWIIGDTQEIFGL